MPREMPSQTFDLAAGAVKTVRCVMRDAPDGGVAAWAVRFRFYDPDGEVLFTLTSADADEILVADDEEGVWDIYLTEAHSTGLPARPHSWDFWRTGTGVARPIAAGTCDVYTTGAS